MVDFLLAVLPSAGVLFLFWVGIRALVHADRRERLAQNRIEREQDEQAARAARDGAAGTGPAPGTPAP